MEMKSATLCEPLLARLKVVAEKEAAKLVGSPQVLAVVRLVQGLVAEIADLKVKYQALEEELVFFKSPRAAPPHQS